MARTVNSNISVEFQHYVHYASDIPLEIDFTVTSVIENLYLWFVKNFCEVQYFPACMTHFYATTPEVGIFSKGHSDFFLF